MTLSLAQLGREEVRNRDVADAVLRLRVVLNRHAAVGRPDDGSVDEDGRRAGVELDVFPPEREEFSGSKTRKDEEIGDLMEFLGPVPAQCRLRFPGDELGAQILELVGGEGLGLSRPGSGYCYPENGVDRDGVVTAS